MVHSICVLEKLPAEEFYEEKDEFILGGSRRLKDGKDITIMAYGRMVYRALKAAELLEAEGISARVSDMYSIKPIDTKEIDEAARDTGKILTVEDHSVVGGLGGMIL